jgi:hypothetical protein
VKLELGPLNEPPAVDLSGSVKIKQIHSMNSTPDGKTIVFDAIGKVWVQDKGKKPRRLSSTTEREYNPIISPDGKSIAYCTWSFTNGGRLWKRKLTGGEPVKLAEMKEAFAIPRWTPDGKRIVAYRARPVVQGPDGDLKQPSLLVADATPGGGGLLRFFGPEMGKITLNLAGGIGTSNIPPMLSVRADGSTLYLTDRLSTAVTDTNTDEKLYAMPVSGGQPQPLLRFKMSGRDSTATAAVSPDGRWLAICEDFNIFVMQMPEANGGEPPIVDVYNDPGVRQLTTDGGVQPIWSVDGKWLTWSWANKFSRLPLEQIDAGVDSKTANFKPTETVIELTVPRAGSRGKLFLTNARIVTMAERGSLTVAQTGGKPMPTDPVVMERGDLLVEGSRIKAVGPSGSIKAPADANVIDLAGKTIVPGYYDLHAHTKHGRLRVAVPEQTPDSALLVAAGFAATQDPWGYYNAMYSAEMVEAGEMVGPHIFHGLQGTSDEAPLTSYAEAEALVRKHKSSGAFLIKEYPGLFGQENPFSSGATPHRVQRQWLAMAAAKYRISLTTEGGPLVHALGLAQDGWNASAHGPIGGRFRHNADLMAFQKLSGMDVQSLGQVERQVERQLPRSPPERLRKEAAYLTGLIDRNWSPVVIEKILKPGLSQADAALKAAMERNGEQPLTPSTVKLGSVVRDLVASGWNMTAGTDSATPYFSAHKEIWTSVLTGQISNAEALRMFTLNAARTLRINKDLGSIEAGKLADFVVLNSNPLDDITNTVDILYVVRGGEVYDPKTMNVLWPTSRKFDMFPWAKKAEETAFKKTTATGLEDDADHR